MNRGDVVEVNWPFSDLSGTKALGGEPFEGVIEGNPSSLMLHILRTEIIRHRQSIGGKLDINGNDLEPQQNR